MAEAKSGNESKARAILIAQRQKVVGRLATAYSSKSILDLISMSKAIEILDQLEKENRPKPGAPDIGMPALVE